MRVIGQTTAQVLDHAREAGFELDPAQLAVLERLDRLSAELAQPSSLKATDPSSTADRPASSAPVSVYLWGPVGRGKTWLLDAFARTLPPSAVRRVHSHRFFDELHRRLHERRGDDAGGRRLQERELFEHAVDDIVGGAGLLVFDELHIGDPGDATLMTRLLELLDERGVALLVSSNSAPGDLLPDPVWHRVFEPGIRLILDRMDVVELAGPVDYRALVAAADAPRGGFASGGWVHPDSVQALGLRRPTPDERTRLYLGGREFSVDAAREAAAGSGSPTRGRAGAGGELWVSFTELCDRPLSTMEYLAWARRFGERWVVTGVPPFARAPRSAQLRFLMAIDVLVDAQVPTFLVSDLDRDQFLTEVRARPSAARLASRLSLLRPRSI